MKEQIYKLGGVPRADNSGMGLTRPGDEAEKIRREAALEHNRLLIILLKKMDELIAATNKQILVSEDSNNHLRQLVRSVG